MKKILSIFTISFLVFNINTTNAQTPSLEQITVNSIAINDCSTIAFGTNSSVNLYLKMKVTKSATTDVGNFATFKLYIKKNASSTPQFINGILVNNSAFGSQGVTWEGVFPLTLQASDIDVSGSIFYGVYEVSTDIHPNTCNYPLTKTPPPSFSLSPTSLSLACSDTGLRTFTVTPANIPSGATVTYQWSTIGWNAIGSTSNSRTLQPASATNLPTNVSVTPYINGVAYPSMSCIVTRAAFTNSATLSGNSVICPGGNGVYSISGLGAGNTVTWSSSNTAVATVSGGTQSQVTVIGLSQGLVNLIATITNPCGQTAPPIIKTINIGAPVMPNGTIYGELWVRKSFYAQTLTFPTVLGATSYTWSIPPNGDFPPNCPATGAVSAKFSNNLQTITTATSSATASFGNCLGDYDVTCTISNACGSTIAYVRYVTVGNTGTSPCFIDYTLNKSFIVSENPIKNGDIKIRKNNTLINNDFELVDETPTQNILDGDGPCYQEWPKPWTGKMNQNVKLNSQIEIKVYNFLGNQVYSKTINASEEEISLKNCNLTTGKYIIHLNDGVNTQKEIIIIE